MSMMMSSNWSWSTWGVCPFERTYFLGEGQELCQDSDIWTTNVSSMLPKDEYNLYGCWPCRHIQLSRTVVAPQKLEDCKQYESFRLIYWTHGRKHDGFTVTVLVGYIGMRLVSTLLIKDPLDWGVLVPILRPYKYQYTSQLVGTWGNTRIYTSIKKPVSISSVYLCDSSPKVGLGPSYQD
jgi:hypothetical protein